MLVNLIPKGLWRVVTGGFLVKSCAGASFDVFFSSFHSFKANFPDVWWLQVDSSSKDVLERFFHVFFKLSLFQSSFSGSRVVTGG